MISDVGNALRGIVGSATHLDHPAGAGRVFELYVMTDIALALKARGYEVFVRRSDGSRVRPTDPDRSFVQRGGVPAGIAAATDGAANASSIVFRREDGPEWEMLNGVTFRGRSGAYHEIDVAIVPAAVATTLRKSGGGSPLGRPRISVECKDVGTNGSVDEMRAFVARLYDLTLLGAHHRHLTVAAQPSAIHPGAPPGPIHRPVPTYWRENRRTLNVLARRTGFVKGGRGPFRVSRSRAPRRRHRTKPLGRSIDVRCRGVDTSQRLLVTARPEAPAVRCPLPLSPDVKWSISWFATARSSRPSPFRS